MWKMQLMGKSKRKGKVERRNVCRWKMKRKKKMVENVSRWEKKMDRKKQIKELEKRIEKIDKILYENFYVTNMIKRVSNFIN